VTSSVAAILQSVDQIHWRYELMNDWPKEHLNTSASTRRSYILFTLGKHCRSTCWIIDATHFQSHIFRGLRPHPIPTAEWNYMRLHWCRVLHVFSV